MVRKDPFQATLAGDLRAFLRLGGIRAIEREAVQEVRREWLPMLEAWHAAYDANGYREQMILATMIQTLRKQLGIKQSAEERRAKTLERVRRHRAAKRGGQAAPSSPKRETMK